ncbi:unnamed protein product [Cladocopium goreaui]|uniref:Fumarylacetoacetate (FAA) hydrolase family protein n=1 Tax=Cladocopium goreaui TaxID=2562237 RepID=A0A9P1CPX1_9DINO|nr:unnamed protein product [Cladocopium goreaui]
MKNCRSFWMLGAQAGVTGDPVSCTSRWLAGSHLRVTVAEGGLLGNRSPRNTTTTWSLQIRSAIRNLQMRNLLRPTQKVTRTCTTMRPFDFFWSGTPKGRRIERTQWWKNSSRVLTKMMRTRSQRERNVRSRHRPPAKPQRVPVLLRTLPRKLGGVDFYCQCVLYMCMCAI